MGNGKILEHPYPSGKAEAHLTYRLLGEDDYLWVLLQVQKELTRATMLETLSDLSPPDLEELLLPKLPTRWPMGGILVPISTFDVQRPERI